MSQPARPPVQNGIDRSARTATTDRTVSEIIGRFLRERSIERLFGLLGGHIIQMWDAAVQQGIKIVDARDERAAIHMAHAHAELTDQLGVAFVTAGPGLTNGITAIANAYVARVPLLVITGSPPRAQSGMGALQEIPHIDLVKSITRHARALPTSRNIAIELDTAVSRAFGEGGEPGPVFLEIPVDVLRETVPDALLLNEHMRAKPVRRMLPDPELVQQAVELICRAERPLIISGRGARGAKRQLVDLLSALEIPYLDTQESRGLVPDEHPSVASAVRGEAMRSTDLLVTVGRRLDYQLAYGSPAIFENAKILRIGRHEGELSDSRRGEVEVRGDVNLVLQALLDSCQGRPRALDKTWVNNLREKHQERSRKMLRRLDREAPGADGLMHPYRLLGAVRSFLDADSIVIADGGDILSFARVALPGVKYLDVGALGCLGVGVPFGIAAGLEFPARKIVSIIGDGSFGFNAMDIDTAARHKANVVFVVANNGAWNIERYDQVARFGGRTAGSILEFSDYAGMAQALGLYAERVKDPAKLQPALVKAFENAPALLDVLVTRDAVSSDFSAGLAEVPDLQALGSWDEAERRRAKPC